MVRATALAAALAILLPSSAFSAPPQGVDAAWTARQIASVRRGLDETLFDYEGARLRDVHMTEDAISFCGQVNSKNRMGGYVGWTPFYALALPGQAALVTVGSDEGSAGVVQSMCSRPENKWAPQDVSAKLAPPKG